MIKTFEELFEELKKIDHKIKIFKEEYKNNIFIKKFRIWELNGKIGILYLAKEEIENFIESTKDLDKVYNFIKAYIELEND